MSDYTATGDAISNERVTSGLDPDSYTASRLRHASAEHLHITSRRFFIGPIPEGWLNSNRKTWYKRKLELSNYSSRQASFTAEDDHGGHLRSYSGLQQPSIAARMQFSFPQPEDVFDEDIGTTDQTDENEGIEDDTDEEIETTAIAPVSTVDASQALGITDANDTAKPKRIPISRDKGLTKVNTNSDGPSKYREGRADSWETAPEVQESLPKITETQNYGQQSSPEDFGNWTSTSTRGASASLHQSPGIHAPADIIDSSSKTALLQIDTTESSTDHNMRERTLTDNDPAPLQSLGVEATAGRKAPGVRFKVAEGVVDRRNRISRKVDSARSHVTNRMVRRITLKAGTIVKMERMLVRVDVTVQQLPDIFDENESMKTETTQIEKWREFMVVARKSDKQDEDDFRLQLYKTRVIPEIENESTKKKPAREIKLLPKSTHVNLYSSLDKTVVLWHPYRKGTRIVILRPNSAAHSVEWYTFLRDALGWHRPSVLQVNVPDLDVTLHLDKPFQGLEAAGLGAKSEEAAIMKTIEAEKAVANKIVSQSMVMLSKDPEWAEVLKSWTETAKMGLAWKRYDRLEWVYGSNEQNMFGSMAMQYSYDLELRPKHHYPTSVYGRKGKLHDEPTPIEGFLVRLTSQKGLHKRLGKAFFKRLYFHTHNEFLVFNRPARASPPHPPRLATISGANVPSSREIVQKSPIMYEIQPFQTEHGTVKWLNANQRNTITQHDAEAVAESRRNFSNLKESDGYINMCQIVKVRKIKWGAHDADDALDSGSEVDFHAPVDDTPREDGTTSQIDDDRVFELKLENDLVVRLQAYNKETRDEWMKRLKMLIKYWKLRAAADITNLKAVRQSNLANLKIDEEMEARLGQFARKWEVSRSDASPDIYNMCRLTMCRTISCSGMLYRKIRRHSTFHRCGVLLSGGQMLIYQASLRKGTGEQVPNIHQEIQEVIDLKECYVYSGLIVEDDLLYQNRTFDANQAGMLAATPRIFLEDGLTSSDVDVMTCFVVWMNRKKGWFRSVLPDNPDKDPKAGSEAKGSTKSKLKRVAQLGVTGRSMVFKCRSRAERDLWVLSVAAEIENAVERSLQEQGTTARQAVADVRLQH